jgi:hypothetical protein
MSELRVVHSSPGRLRVRVPPAVPSDDLAEAVLREAGVLGSRWSARTRSLLVLYRPDTVDADGLTDTVARLTGTRRPAASNGLDGETVSAEPGAVITGGLRDAARVVDQRVQRATGGALGLGSLLPVALIGWALIEVARGRTGPLTWSTALWYAHGLFRDYSLPPTRD